MMNGMPEKLYVLNEHQEYAIVKGDYPGSTIYIRADIYDYAIQVLKDAQEIIEQEIIKNG